MGNGIERRFDRIRTPSWGYSPGQYGFNSYSRPSLALGTLEATIVKTFASKECAPALIRIACSRS